ncbi:anti-CBASS protein Acb1 family protein [Pseudovibrio sp. SPO723]|uniref:anti-CBASS protein Acb1 family protein n=1 Tax=Nesiotobacter zosterae TaxID=392721 RepID=UPI0029C19572|nr:anti-CBASS Acb1 family protein [Pseudovibrio sp. SPO723]MDX5592569.1 DUF1073 domain-containing protein [Pseudovibrio sp. SPO723]
MNIKSRLLANAVTRNLGSVFPGFFGSGYVGTKHDHNKDFGYPERLTFEHMYTMYSRNGLASGVINGTASKTWEEYPYLLESDEQHDETKTERDVREAFDRLRLWQQLQEADRRSLVGRYAAVIIRYADNKAFNQPVDRVAGLDAVVEIIPAWEKQITVSQWDTDTASETYGQPLMFQFNESAVPDQREQPRNFMVHPDRVIIWSRDGTVHGRPLLESCYNALIDIEKIRGAGGEGFWRNSRGSVALQTSPDIDAQSIAQSMGVEIEDVQEKMSKQVQDWASGFDKLLMLQGMEANSIQSDLPSPEHFYWSAINEVTACSSMPVKILIGNQTGERASTEDAQAWAQHCMSRRTGTVKPCIMSGLVERFVRFGVLPERDWYLSWTDLTEASMSEKIDRAGKMADVNQKHSDSGEWVFTPDEIREAIGYEPLADADRYREEPPDDEEFAAL